MGNKLSCNCGPLSRKPYRYEDTPWSGGVGGGGGGAGPGGGATGSSSRSFSKRDGHLLRLWAEVFHVSSAGGGTVKWQQVSEDLVPVNITCIQDSPEVVFHITAYNSQVDKILDVRLVQPGTRIGQASECFVYWKDPVTSDTWGLNFTSPIDAKQFRECCSPACKFSRKASSSYSLRLDSNGRAASGGATAAVGTGGRGGSMAGSRSGSGRIAATSAAHANGGGAGMMGGAMGPGGRRRPLSTPTSPSKSREPQCTCMTAEQYARLRAMDPRFRAASTLPRATQNQNQAQNQGQGNQGQVPCGAGQKVTGTDTTYAVVRRQTESKGTGTGDPILDEVLPPSGRSATLGPDGRSRSTTRGGRDIQIVASKSVDYSDPIETTMGNGVGGGGRSGGGTIDRKNRKSKSTDDVTIEREKHGHGHGHGHERGGGERGGASSSGSGAGTSSRRVAGSTHQHQQTEQNTHAQRSRTLPSKSTIGTNTTPTGDSLTDSQTLKRLLKPIGGQVMTSTMTCTAGSVVTSPELNSRRTFRHQDGYISEPEIRQHSNTAIHGHACTHAHQMLGKRTTDTLRRCHDRDRVSRGIGTQTVSKSAKLSMSMSDRSPPSDQPVFDHAYYATTPPSSSPEGDGRTNGHAPPNGPSPGSPTARLLLEYEQHLRNTLAKGMDAESYSLHTFEAIISQSNENLAVPPNSRSTTLPRFLPQSSSRDSNMSMGHSHRVSRETSRESRDSDGLSGYYSDFRERDRDRGYLSDHNSRSSGGFYGGGDAGSNKSGYYSDRENNRSGYFSDREVHIVHHHGGGHGMHSTSKYGSIRHQASVESADSRLCYLTSSEISDDERMSLTTAVSDDEPGDGTSSPKGSRKPAASFNCTGAVRKAGFLSVKKWLLRKRHQVELARRRGWKGYWVCLKGTTLLFYPCDARETRSVEAAPKHLIIVDGAIMQPIPEHPKRDYIFCLSTAFGDAYLFQAPCQVELESWVHSIHWACAAAFARHRGKTGTLHLLQEEIVRLDKSIESDGKLRHMAELQRSVVADPETRQQLAQQIGSWEENIERLHCEQFRLRCYMASLQGGELPNPKSLLSHISRTTKNTLNRLGVFTVSSFHAFVCARSPSLLSNLLAGRGATKRRAPLLSRSNSASSRRSLHNCGTDRENERCAKISLPENVVVTVPLKDAMSVEEFLVSACARKGLAPLEHFVRVKKRRELPDTNYFVPHRSDLIDTYLSTHEVVEVRAKLLYQVELARGALDQMWGFSVEAELVENSDRQDELCCYVSRVEDRSVAMNNGIIKGDEILVINGAIVSDLDMMYIESVLQEELSLCLMLRSSRTEPPALAAALAAADAAIAQLVCPPPPLDPLLLTDDFLSHLIVPAPHQNKDLSPSDTEDVGNISGGEAVSSSRGGRKTSRTDSTEIENLLKSAEQVTASCRTKDRKRNHLHQLHQQRSSEEREEKPGKSSSNGLLAPSAGGETPPQDLSDTNSPSHISQAGSTSGGSGCGTLSGRDIEKMKKIVTELIDTERAYVKHLTCLLEQYLEPLRHENFLSTTEMMAIFGNIREMVTVQRRFLRSLEASVGGGGDSEPPMEGDLTNILHKIASAFLSFADHFKLYSSFCASHSKAQKLLHPVEGNQALQHFLQQRNPRQQHSNTLESYLIKPIQRILKYPLLLQQLRNLCDTNTNEYRNLVDALQCMERVAEHINEMQRIHEEYGAIFEHLFRQHQKLCKIQIDLSPGDLLHYGGVEWLNIAEFLGKIKKGLELHAMCFVFRSAVVFLCKERLRHKKKLITGSKGGLGDKSEVEIIRYQVLIPVSEVQVRQIEPAKSPETPAEVSAANNSNFSWELVHLRNQSQRRTEKIYLLSNSTAEFRNAFLRNIRQIIRESVRNMSLPPRLGSLDGDSEGSGGKGGGSIGGGSHYATPEGIEITEGGHGAASSVHASGTQTLGRKSKPKPPQRHSAGALETGGLKREDSTESTGGGAAFRSRSKTMSDAMKEGKGGKGEDQEGGTGKKSGAMTMPRMKGMLGNTPNHLTLSTTSTLSAGSTGSAAKLIQASSTPARFSAAPPPPEPSSPIWKPREAGAGFDSATLPKKLDSSGGGASGGGGEKAGPSSQGGGGASTSGSSGAGAGPSTSKSETLPRQSR